jgi:hypothetical protein
MQSAEAFQDLCHWVRTPPRSVNNGETCDWPIAEKLEDFLSINGC